MSPLGVEFSVHLDCSTNLLSQLEHFLISFLYLLLEGLILDLQLLEVHQMQAIPELILCSYRPLQLLCLTIQSNIDNTLLVQFLRNLMSTSYQVLHLLNTQDGVQLDVLYFE